MGYRFEAFEQYKQDEKNKIDESTENINKGLHQGMEDIINNADESDILYASEEDLILSIQRHIQSSEKDFQEFLAEKIDNNTIFDNLINYHKNFSSNMIKHAEQTKLIEKQNPLVFAEKKIMETNNQAAIAVLNQAKSSMAAHPNLQDSIEEMMFRTCDIAQAIKNDKIQPKQLREYNNALDGLKKQGMGKLETLGNKFLSSMYKLIGNTKEAEAIDKKIATSGAINKVVGHFDKMAFAAKNRLTAKQENNPELQEASDNTVKFKQ